MLLSSLQDKDIINVSDGRKIGVIIDADIDKGGKIVEFLVQKKRFFFFGTTTYKVGFGQIDKIGKDVILVNVSS
ncbi:MAG: YlmC/YmxH family sporulation protein [Bacilli bacterium]|nr:YlmC/YmxH family sporulation protein [Bacilli bacterium]